MLNNRDVKNLYLVKKQEKMEKPELEKSGTRSYKEIVHLITKVKEKIEKLENFTPAHSQSPHVRFL